MQTWQGRAQSRRRCGGMSPVPAQTWQGEPSPGADVAAMSTVPVQMWQEKAQSRLDAGVAGVSAVPVQMWQGQAPITAQMRQGPVKGCIRVALAPTHARAVARERERRCARPLVLRKARLVERYVVLAEVLTGVLISTHRVLASTPVSTTLTVGRW